MIRREFPLNLAFTLAVCVGSVGLLRNLTAAAPEASEYVDSRLCAQCHRQIAEDYARTGMGRSFSRPAATAPSEDYGPSVPFHHDLSDTWFSMTRRGGEYFQRRWQIGPGGGEVNVEELRVDYVMGSGNHARSYLHRTARGTLIELPLGWYPEQITTTGGLPGPGHWGMSPGSDTPRPRTRRFVAYKCMFCHISYPRIPAANAAPDTEPVFTGELPEGIDCQRCHGPGGQHLRTVRNGASTRADVQASILNPARLTSERRMEVCMQCHLETSSGRIPASIVRFDRAPFSYNPAEPLGSFLLAFDHAPGSGHEQKFEAVSSVYRLRQSQCFLKSAGKLTCETCHNPHRAPRGIEAITHFDTVCRQCHAVAFRKLVNAGTHSASSDCASCHMPKRRAEDTPGMIMTDHLIQRRPPSDLLADFREKEPEDYRGEVAPYYPSPLPRTPQNALYTAVAQVGLRNNAEAGLPVLAREVARQKPNNAQFYLVLGDGWLAAGKPQEAIAAYRDAVALDPKRSAALRSLAIAYQSAGQPLLAAESLRKALQNDSSDAVTWYRYGMLDLASGRAPEALEKVRKAIALDPSLPDQSRGLAEILMALGRPDEAEAAVADALRTDPFDADAWDLNARLQTEKGSSADAVYSFERAIQLQPGSATHLYDYALALARMNRFTEARNRAEAAVQSDGNRPEAHELLGGLFEQSNEFDRAADEYRSVLRLQPSSARVQLRLGLVLLNLGDKPGALTQLQAAARASDAAVRQQASDALRRLGRTQ